VILHRHILMQVQGNYNNYPPTTQFLNGTCGLTYVGNCENISYPALSYLMGTSPISA